MLRHLKRKDVYGMLEWINSDETRKHFCFDNTSITEKEALVFIENANKFEQSSEQKNLHLAIVDHEDEYLGTISLKNINTTDSNAEFAISLRERARGKNIARQATFDILKIAFDDYKLHRVYLNVYSNNERAIRFYEKSGFKYEGEFREHIYKEKEYRSIKWFSIIESEFCRNIVHVL